MGPPGATSHTLIPIEPDRAVDAVASLTRSVSEATRHREFMHR